MNLTADTTTPPSLRRVLVFLALGCVGVLAAHSLDLIVYGAFHNHEAAANGLPKMFRSAGYIPVWILVAGALICIDTAKWKNLGLAGVLQRGLPILLTVVLAGVITEGTKCMIHRGRPPEVGWDGHYPFRPFSTGFFNTDSVGMPSSHVGVAFGAAWILMRLYPRGIVIWILLGVGCAWERLLDRAHFFSDLVGGTMAGFAAAWLVWHGWRHLFGFRDWDSSSPIENQVPPVTVEMIRTINPHAATFPDRRLAKSGHAELRD
ncbi:MAG TPA: phosphatase PAP2 family protein [Gemmataceae bacterium]|nr:phosphatase PAP2 family protein [Gemmataceae bacterium]